MTWIPFNKHVTDRSAAAGRGNVHKERKRLAPDSGPKWNWASCHRRFRWTLIRAGAIFQGCGSSHHRTANGSAKLGRARQGEERVAPTGKGP
jgi:hypothetical protein